MSAYIIPIVIFAVLGLAAGILLTAASKIFYVKTDERIEQITDILPQANCGACGFAGCADYANAIVKDGLPTNLCKPGGSEASAKISAVLGTQTLEVTPETAVVHCRGNCEAVKKRFIFDGIQTCAAAKRFHGGEGSCAYGCLGYGDCASVCDEKAIEIVNGVAEVTGVCGACGKCVKVCPNGLISIKPVAKHIDVKCSSEDNGKITKLSCKNGCIGCKICEKKCLHDAIKVIDFHAVIDYNKCTGCASCFEACPTGAITNCEDL